MAAYTSNAKKVNMDASVWVHAACACAQQAARFKVKACKKIVWVHAL